MLARTLIVLPPLLALAGCASRVHEVDLEATLDTEARAPIAEATLEVGGPRADPATIVAEGPTLSLVFVPEGETLPVREAPSIDAEIVDALDRFTLDVPSTGRVTRVHSITWVEVLTDAGLGWIPKSYTTDFVPSEDFCEAPEVADDLLGELAAAVRDNNADRLAAVLSPTHGVRVRYVRTDEPVRFTTEWAATSMAEGQSIDWGVDPESGEVVRGSFGERVGDELAVAISNGEVTCNRLVTGAAPYLADVPESEVNLNFVSVHLPATDALGMTWVTWTVGVSFEDGRSTIATLNRYAWEG